MLCNFSSLRMQSLGFFFGRPSSKNSLKIKIHKSIPVWAACRDVREVKHPNEMYLRHLEQAQYNEVWTKD